MLSVSVLVLLALAVPREASAMPRPLVPEELVTRRPQTDDDRINYLIRYGHMTAEPNQLSDDNLLRNSIANLQRFAGIPVTGEMDDATDRLMATPRCGLPDDLTTTRRRRRRYVVQGSKWGRQSMTYLFKNYSSKLPPDVTRKAIKRALQIWSDVSPLDFAEAPSGANEADIKILFANRYHGDSGTFDGPGGVLAHAYFPSSGATHFDEDEPWTDGVKSGVNFQQVATHELGHALGLGHSKVLGSVMAPFYKGYDAKFALKQDDIDGIQSIYGKPQKSKSKAEPRLDALVMSPSSSKSTPSSATDNTLVSMTTALKDAIMKPMPTLTGTVTTTSSSTPTTTSTLSSTTSTTFPTTTTRAEATPTRNSSPIIGSRTNAIVAKTTFPLRSSGVNSLRKTSPVRTTVLPSTTTATTSNTAATLCSWIWHFFGRC